MRLYLAARYHRREELGALARSIAELGHQVTSRWLNGFGQDDADSALYDLTDVVVADALVLFTEKSARLRAQGGGRHVEFGYALYANKALFLVGPRENIFHQLPQVRRFADADELLDFLARPALAEAWP
jgi:hypothetical protein